MLLNKMNILAQPGKWTQDLMRTVRVKVNLLRGKLAVAKLV